MLIKRDHLMISLFNLPTSLFDSLTSFFFFFHPGSYNTTRIDSTRLDAGLTLGIPIAIGSNTDDTRGPAGVMSFVSTDSDPDLDLDSDLDPNLDLDSDLDLDFNLNSNSNSKSKSNAGTPGHPIVTGRSRIGSGIPSQRSFSDPVDARFLGKSVGML